MKAYLHYGKNGAKLEGFEKQIKLFSIFKTHSLSQKACLQYGKNGAKLVGFEEKNIFFFILKIYLVSWRLIYTMAKMALS